MYTTYTHTHVHAVMHVKSYEEYLYNTRKLLQKKSLETA